MISEYPITAHVGYTETDDDYYRVTETENFLQYRYDLENVDLFQNGDMLDLNRGRDFLAESKQYDIVVLHYIWNNYSSRGDILPANSWGVFNISKMHKAEKWRQRLIATQAKHIIAYGSSTEVTGYYLNEIPGYDMNERVQSIMFMNSTTYTRLTF